LINTTIIIRNIKNIVNVGKIKESRKTMVKKEIDRKLILLFSLMNLDYLLTKLGIYLNLIIEGNFLMNWLINLPIHIGFPIRIVLSL
jgi:hypothetical protein